jgi:hypothetical protein
MPPAVMTMATPTFSATDVQPLDHAGQLGPTSACQAGDADDLTG